MPSPLVSVLIPAYRAEATLAATLDSVLAQTYPNVEAIVVDDGSGDGTLDVARAYEDRGVRVILQPNAGASAARNAAFARSHGEYIQFLDADDILGPSKIAVQIERLAHEPDGTIASAAWGSFFGDADPDPSLLDTLSDWRDFDPASDWLVHSWLEGTWMMHSCWLTPRNLYESVGPWNELVSVNDDGEYNARVMTTARRIAFCPDAHVYYRAGQLGSLSARRDQEAAQSLFLSYVLSEAHLFAHDASDRAHRAVARRWEEFAYEFYLDPFCRGMVRYAEVRARQLGGFTIDKSFSPRYNTLQKIFGWKVALHTQAAVKRLGLQRSLNPST